MNLRHITDTVCPQCGSEINEDTQRRPHTNGQHFETRSFVCGLQLKWVPNFSCQEITGECTRHASHTIKVKKRQAAVELLRNGIAKLDVDADFKESLLHRIGTSSYN